MSGTEEKELKIPYWVIDIITLVSGVCTILTSIVGFLDVRKTIQEVPDGQYEIVLNKGFIWIIFILVFLFIVVFSKMFKYGRLLHKTRMGISKNYYNFLHDFRNQYFEMIKEYKLNTENTDIRQIELLTKMTKDYLIKSLDYLCDVVSISSGAEISGCIKVIDNIGGEGNKINLDKALVRTFCRSTNTDGNRKTQDMMNKGKKSVRIVDNTDFCDILCGDCGSYFYQQDLVQYAKGLENLGKIYKNSTEQYWKYYRGVVVAPIRIAQERLYYLDSNDNFDVIGFLCIDTMSTNVFREKDRVFYSKIVKSFAAEIYIILNKYNYYLKKIMGE